MNYRANKTPVAAQIIQPPTVKSEVVSEQNYTSSLEQFVKMMDNSALDSVTKFIKNLRQPTNHTNGLLLSTELFSQLKSEPEKPQIDIPWDSVKNLTTLSSEGFDVGFLEKIDPSIQLPEQEDR